MWSKVKALLQGSDQHLCRSQQRSLWESEPAASVSGPGAAIGQQSSQWERYKLEARRRRTTWNLCLAPLSDLDNTDNLQKNWHPLPQSCMRCWPRTHRTFWRSDGNWGSPTSEHNGCCLVPPSKSHANFSCAQPQPGAAGTGIVGTQLLLQHKTPTRH